MSYHCCEYVVPGRFDNVSVAPELYCRLIVSSLATLAALSGNFVGILIPQLASVLDQPCLRANIPNAGESPLCVHLRLAVSLFFSVAAVFLFPASHCAPVSLYQKVSTYHRLHRATVVCLMPTLPAMMEPDVAQGFSAPLCLPSENSLPTCQISCVVPYSV